MMSKLLEQERKLQEKIKAWEDYKSSEKKYYKIPNPNQIDGHYLIRDINQFTIAEYKKKLEFLKIISEYYDNNDYIVDIDAFFREEIDDNYIRNAHITKEARDKLHRLILNIEAQIEDFENEKNR